LTDPGDIIAFGKNCKMNRRFLTFLCFMTFVLCAFNFMALPKTIYDIGLHFGWRGTQKGILLSVSSIGFIFAALIGGYLSELFGKKQVMIFGLIFSIFGNITFGYFLGLNLPQTFYLLLFSNFFIGAAGGILEGATNALVIHLHPDRGSLYLNLAHAFFAIGALGAPIIGGWLILLFNWQVVFYLNAAISTGIFGLIFFQSCPQFRMEEGIKLKIFSDLLKNKIFLLLNLCILFYVAAETGLVAWLAEYFRVNPNFKLSQFQSGMFLSYFWVTMLIGRFTYGWLVEKTSSSLALSLSSIGGMISIALFLTTSNIIIASLLIFACGGFLSGMFATIFSLAGERFPHYLGVVSGSMTTSVGIGGIVSPNVIGRLSDIPGMGLSAGLATCIIYLLMVLLIVLSLSKSKEKLPSQ